MFEGGQPTFVEKRKEMELFRVFDSLEYVDKEVDKIESGINASGSLDAQQTAEILLPDISY